MVEWKNGCGIGSDGSDDETEEAGEEEEPVDCDGSTGTTGAGCGGWMAAALLPLTLMMPTWCQYSLSCTWAGVEGGRWGASTVWGEAREEGSSSWWRWGEPARVPCCRKELAEVEEEEEGGVLRFLLLGGVRGGGREEAEVKTEDDDCVRGGGSGASDRAEVVVL
jgi:hypothetical protein